MSSFASPSVADAASFEIREARPEEYAAAGEVCAVAYAAFGEIDMSYLDEVRDVAHRAEVVPVLVAAERDGTLLGTVTYVPGPGPFAETEREGEAGFRMLAVAPWAQGRGVGRKLVAACVDRAREDGRVGMAILTSPDMRVAHGLYASMGFVRDPSRDWEYEPGKMLWSYRLAL
jgi:GNAT superfamily N-acetyltransferase